jgi:hypothetical protein
MSCFPSLNAVVSYSCRFLPYSAVVVLSQASAVEHGIRRKGVNAGTDLAPCRVAACSNYRRQSSSVWFKVGRLTACTWHMSSYTMPFANAVVAGQAEAGGLHVAKLLARGSDKNFQRIR